MMDRSNASRGKHVAPGQVFDDEPEAQEEERPTSQQEELPEVLREEEPSASPEAQPTAQPEASQQPSAGRGVAPNGVRKVPAAMVGGIVLLNILLISALAFALISGGAQLVNQLSANEDATGQASTNNGTTDVQEEEVDQDTDASAVAASVGELVIAESDVTDYIQQFRSNNGLSDDSDFASWLDSTGYTAEALRQQVILYYVQSYLDALAVSENGITVTDEDIDAQMESLRAQYDSDEDWEAALAEVGYTEDTYRDVVEQSLAEQAIVDQLANGGTYEDWLNDYATEKGLVVNDMPADVPYNVTE